MIATRAAGAKEAGDILKPALSRGEIRVHWRHDARRVPQVHRERQRARASLSESGAQRAQRRRHHFSILRGLRERYESHYGLEVQDAALVAAAKLSDRYIQDRFQPDKSIDCIDSAFATLRVALDSKPEAIDQLERRKMQLEIEKISLQEREERQGAPAGGRRRARVDQRQAEAAARAV
jgi:ATP-dependent Clp protease ATP-binding subunit ClpB